jgi:hypothetical protein
MASGRVPITVNTFNIYNFLGARQHHIDKILAVLPGAWIFQGFSVKVGSDFRIYRL